jgi:aldose 1-epimerase
MQPRRHHDWGMPDGRPATKMGSMDKPTSIPLTGAQYEISAGPYHAAVTELGAGLRQLTYRGRPVISGYEPDELPPAAAGQLLAPWPNRIDGGRYSFAGMTCQLDLSEPAQGNAIHGLTRWAGWRARRHDADSVQLSHLLPGSPGYPFCVDLTAEYRLSAGEGLQVTITARNAGTRPAPYGTGSHPYLTAGTPAIDDCELMLPAAQWLPPGPRGIPAASPQDVSGTPYDFRTARTIGGLRLDHAFTGLARDASGRAWAQLSTAGAQVWFWAGPGYRWLQVFTGDPLDPPHRRRALAVEPMTCPPNAFVTGHDLITLPPGGAARHAWGIRAHQP